MNQSEELNYTEYSSKDGRQNIRIEPEGWCLPKSFLNKFESYRNFNVRNDDVWILGFARSGTTMTQTIVWSILNDFQEQSAYKTFDKIIFFERDIIQGDFNAATSSNKIINDYLKIVGDPLTVLNNMTQNRVVKSHLPFKFLPKELLTNPKVKMIYLLRNPKDVIVSFYKFKGKNYENIQKYFEDFKDSKITYCPYWAQVRQACELRHLKNILFLQYEDVCKNLKESIKNIADFLGKQLTDSQIENIEKLVSFENFKEGYNTFEKDLKKTGFPMLGPIVKSGKTNSWKEIFPPELNNEVDNWIRENSQQIQDLTISR